MRRSKGPRFAPSPKMVREAYKDAIDPNLRPAKMTRLHEMSPEKIAELEKLYGPVAKKPAPVKLPPLKVKIKGKEMTDYRLTCPECSRAMKLRSGPYSAFYGCTGYPKCKGLVKSYPDGRPQA